VLQCPQSATGHSTGAYTWRPPTRMTCKRARARLRRKSGSSVRMTPAITALPAASSASRGISVNGGTTSLHTVTSDTACGAGAPLQPHAAGRKQVRLCASTRRRNAS